MKVKEFILFNMFFYCIPLQFAMAEPVLSNHDLARAEWIKGFHKLEQAEYSVEFGNYQNALDLFNEARRIFEQVRNGYKRWNQSLLNYRINYCEQKIRRIEKLSDLNEVDIDALLMKEKEREEPSKRSASQLRRYQELEKENLVLNNRIKELEGKLDRTESQVKSNAKFLILQKELERIERHKAESDRIKKNLETEVSDLTKQVLVLSSNQEKSILKIAEKDRDFKLISSQLADNEAKALQKEKLLQRKHEQIRELEKRNNAISVKLNAGNKLISELTQKTHQLEADFKTKTKDLEIAQVEIGNHKEKVSKLEALLSLGKTQHEEYTSQLDSFRLKISKLQDLINKLETDNVKLNEDLTLKVSEFVTLQVELQAKNEKELEFQRLEDSREIEYEKKLNELKKNREELAYAKTARDQLQAKVSKLNSEIELAKSNENALNAKLLEYQTKLKEREESQRLLKMNLDALSQSNSTLRLKVENLNQRVAISSEVLQSVNFLKEQLERAQELKREFQKISFEESSPLFRKLGRNDLNQGGADRASPNEVHDVMLEDQGGRSLDSKEFEGTSGNRPEKLKDQSFLPSNNRKDPEKPQIHGQKSNKNGLEFNDLDVKEPDLEKPNPSEPYDNLTGLSDYSDTIQHLLLEGETALINGRLEIAIIKFQEVIKRDPNQKTALIELSKLLIEGEHYVRAEQNLRAAYPQHSTDIEFIMQLATVLIKSNKNALAISELIQAESLYPNNPDLLRLLGIAYQNVGILNTAEIRLKRSFELDNTNSETAFSLAELYASMKPPEIENVKEWYKLARNLGAEKNIHLDDLLKEYASVGTDIE